MTASQAVLNIYTFTIVIAGAEKRIIKKNAILHYSS